MSEATPAKPRRSRAAKPKGDVVVPFPPEVTAPRAPEPSPHEALDLALRKLSLVEHMTYERADGVCNVRLEGILSCAELAEIRAWQADRADPNRSA